MITKVVKAIKILPFVSNSYAKVAQKDKQGAQLKGLPIRLVIGNSILIMGKPNLTHTIQVPIIAISFILLFA